MNVSRCHVNPGVCLEDSVLHRSFEGTSSPFLGVDIIGELTSSRISSPLKL